MRFGAFLRGMMGGSRVDPGATLRVKAWTRAALGAPESTALTVNEIACLDPGCPGAETVILIMEPGRKTRAVKIPKLLDEVTELDVRAALGFVEGPASTQPVSPEPSS